MANGEPPDRPLYRRGRLTTALNRWLSLALGALALFILWGAPDVRPVPALAVGTGYALFAIAAQLWRRRFGSSFRLRLVHDLVDALTVAGGAAFTGGVRSPVWLFLYPHVVAVSVRGGLLYAMGMGLVDGLIVMALGWLSDGGPFSALYALSLLWCGFMGGTVSSYLHDVQRRLSQANQSLRGTNSELLATLAEAQRSRERQEGALARLRESEERYRGLLERIQDGVVIVSEGRIAYVNGVFSRMVGDTPAGLIDGDFQQLLPPEEGARLAELYRRWESSPVLAGELETQLRTRDGALLTVHLRAGSVEWNGRRSMLTTVRDVSRERRMEQDVKAHAARLAALNEVANAVNRSLTIEDIFSVAADEVRRIVPFERLTIALLDERSAAVELVAVGPGARRHPAGFRREDVTWAFRRPMAWHDGGGEPQPKHLPELAADNRVRAAASVPLVSKERVIGAMCLARLEPRPFSGADLAAIEPVASHVAIALDNARLLEAVRRRGREFESLVEISRRIVERLEPEEILPLVTKSVNRVMGTHFCLLMLRDGELLHTAAHEGLEPAVVARFQTIRVGESLTGRVAEEGRALSVPDMQADPRTAFPDVVAEYGYRAFLGVPLLRGGEVLGTLEVVSKQARSFGPEEEGMLNAFADATAVAIDHARLFQEARRQMDALAEANRRLEDLDRLRQDYLRNVSHEFRTPLTVIRGWAEYLRGGGLPDEAALKDVMRIVIESCDRVIDMVDTLIEVSRVEQGSAAATLQVQSLDLAELVQSALEPLRAQADKKGLTLSLELGTAPLHAEADGGLLQQVVRKLVDNAIKYSARDKRVCVRARDDGDSVELRVVDEGAGIPPEHLPRIFEKFYMVDGGLTRRVGGSGVGLYLVREILRLHGASVAVESEPGQGSCFTVRLRKVFMQPAERR